MLGLVVHLPSLGKAQMIAVNMSRKFLKSNRPNQLQNKLPPERLGSRNP